MTRKTALNLSMVLLVAFALGGVLYFSGLTHKYSDTEPAAGQQDNTGMYSESQAPARMAQFQARCSGADGTVITGAVNIPQEQNPDTLEVIEIQTSNGKAQFAKGACEFAPH